MPFQSPNVVRPVLFSALFLLPVPSLHAQIVLDGDFSDWSAIPPALSDPVDAPSAAVDFQIIKSSADARTISLFAQWSSLINLQGLNGSILLLVDADGQASTGKSAFQMPGVDFALQFSPPEDQHPGKGAAVITDPAALQPPPAPSSAPSPQPASKSNLAYQLNVHFAPTYAGDANEIRFARFTRLHQVLNNQPLFAGPSAAFKFVFLDLAGNLCDETHPFSVQLPPSFLDAPGSDLDPALDSGSSTPLAKLNKDALRVVSWNVELGKMFSNPQPFARILNALNPDVILFQELKDSKNAPGAQELIVFLHDRVPPGGHWYVQFGPGGGDLHCAVASRTSLDRVPELTTIPDPLNPRYTVRTMGAVGKYQDRKILFTAVHLKCCGVIGGDEDEKRMKEAAALHSAILAADQSVPCDATIIAGDFNLVGSRQPLDMLCDGLDEDRSALSPALPLHLDGVSSFTWRDPFQPFLPSRLDFLLYSDSQLSVSRAFVMDSADLSSEALEHYSLLADDSASSSDHLPIVIDLLWKSPPAD